MTEKQNYKIIGRIEIKDGSGQTQGVYKEGFVYTFEKELGDFYVEQGLAILSDSTVGTRAVEGEVPTEEEANRVGLFVYIPQAPSPTDDSAPINFIEHPTMPTQAEENATIGIDTTIGQDQSVTVEYGNYEITAEDVEFAGTKMEFGEQYFIAESIGDALVAEGKALKIVE